ncbi:MAG: hypothetical protein ACI9Y1_001479 [Lentisphaeria bacterium]|jgi:hypothetical protein
MSNNDIKSDLKHDVPQQENKKVWAAPKMIPLSTSETEGAKPATPTESGIFSGPS